MITAAGARRALYEPIAASSHLQTHNIAYAVLVHADAVKG